jgi:8-oxo-dGTP pyrophosphatase MutT (NUDIX family)
MNQKANAYIHTQFPEAGLRVPGGTLEQGEPPEEGVLREALEETGLTGLRIVKFILSDAVQHQGTPVKRHFFLLEVAGEPLETWLSCEWQPSDGSPAPITFEFFWVEPDSVKLAGGMEPPHLF